MRGRAATAILMLTLGPFSGGSPALAQVICKTDECVATRMGEDTFVAGGEVRIDAHLEGDALIAGGALVVRGAIKGDVAAAGGSIELTSTIGNDLYAAGGDVDVDGSVGGNARLAGGQVTLGPNGRIDGGVSLGAGRAVLEGAIGGYLQGGAGELIIDGVIDGDVDIGAGELTVGPHARIGGRLRYRSEQEARIDPAARVAGGVERSPAAHDWGRFGPKVLSPAAWIAGLLWLAGAALLGTLIILAAPRFSASSGRVARNEIGLAAIVGFAFLVTVPVAAVLLMLTVIGIPLGIAVLLGYLVAVFLGWLFAVIAVGDSALARFAAGTAGRRGVRVAAFLVAFIAVALLARLPWIGGLVSLIVLIVGTGAFVLATYRSWHSDVPAVATT